MNRALQVLLLFLLLFVPLSCRSTGRQIAGGAFETAREWYDKEGRIIVEDTARRLVDSAKEKIEEERKEQVEKLEKKIEEGKATPWEIALYIMLGGSAAGVTRTWLSRKKNGSS